MPRTCRRCPGTEGETSVEAARQAADDMGYPILLKASAGGGGKGMRLVTEPDELADSFGAAAAEAQAAFGDARLYVEKALVPGAPCRDPGALRRAGGVLTLGERECSIQRRHQKLIEESPSAALTPETRESMEAAAERACRAVGYRNAGHVRVPARPRRQLLLHRAERAAPGRAPGDGARHRHRSRSRAAARRRGRAARRRPAGRLDAAMRSRSG